MRLHPRLFVSVATLLIFGSSTVVAQTVPHSGGGVTKLSKIQWESSDVLPSCMKVATIHGDPHTGAATFALKATAGCAMGWHWHSANELVSMISGTFRLQMEGSSETFVMTASDFGAIPAKHKHREVCTKDCVAYVTIDGPFDVHYVDDSGKELSIEEGIKRSSKETKF